MKVVQRERVSDRMHSLKRACVTVFFFYVFLLLLNGKGIYDGVGRLEYGTQRDLLLKVVEPVRFVSEVTRAAKLREGVELFSHKWLNN